jgi:peptide/nickel transport system substrate-binding protein
MDRRGFLKTAGASAASLPFLRALPSAAAGGDTIVMVFGQTINSLDLHRTGTNRPSYQIAVNCYDRLVEFGIKTLPDGSLSYDYATLVPGVAESWSISDDGLTVTFRLRPEGRFQNGDPITAADVKWSYDRAVTVGGFPTTQMKAGGLSRPDQFEAVDDLTFVVRLDAPSKLSLPDMAVPVPFILNSRLALANATADDPWALEYVHKNTIGSGPFKVTRWEPGQQLVYERNDDWTAGPLPEIRRVILREVPSPATRRALIERGDVQMSFDIPNKDAKELEGTAGLTVDTTPIENAIYVLGTNLNFEPFRDKRVRQAVAWSVPYEDVFQTAAYGRGVPMWGAPSATPETAAWPQPFPYSTDLDRAKALMEEAGFGAGFEVPFSIDLSQSDWMEPAALLIQENLAKIGIKAPIEKIPGANWRTASLVEKKLPLHLETFGGWLNYPCYYFYWAYIEGNLFNSVNYRNEEIEAMVPKALPLAADDPEYVAMCNRMIEIAWDEIPRIALWQPAVNAAYRDMAGYEYWFHRQPTIRGWKTA